MIDPIGDDGRPLSLGEMVEEAIFKEIADQVETLGLCCRRSGGKMWLEHDEDLWLRLDYRRLARVALEVVDDFFEDKPTA